MTEDSNTAILKKRADILARPLQQTDHKDQGLSLLTFTLGPESCAIETKYVTDVVSTSELTPLPSVPAFVVGILSVQGRIWSVIDIRDFFSIPKQGISDHPRAILVETPTLRFGIMADSKLDIVRVSSLTPPPEVNERIPRNFIKGTLEHTTVVFDLETLSTDPRLIVNDG